MGNGYKMKRVGISWWLLKPSDWLYSFVYVWQLPLKVLIASNNKLVSLPEEIGHLRHLMELVSEYFIFSIVLCIYVCVLKSRNITLLTKTIALTIRAFVDTVMSLVFNMLSRFIIAFLPRSKHLLISWLQLLSVILGPKKIKSVTASVSQKPIHFKNQIIVQTVELFLDTES